MRTLRQIVDGKSPLTQSECGRLNSQIAYRHSTVDEVRAKMGLEPMRMTAVNNTGSNSGSGSNGYVPGPDFEYNGNITIGGSSVPIGGSTAQPRFLPLPSIPSGGFGNGGGLFFDLEAAKDEAYGRGYKDGYGAGVRDEAARRDIKKPQLIDPVSSKRRISEE